jgi:hypothetical protein
MKIRLALFLLLLLPLSCGLFHPNDEAADKGMVTWTNVEGGGFLIFGDHGTNYNPINLPADCQRDGLRVFFRGKILHDRTSFLGGVIIEILSITKLE